jgi:hypothetical protein
MCSLVVGAYALQSNNVRAVFLEGEFEKNAEGILWCTFRWEDGIILKYDNTDYDVSFGQIFFDINKKEGTLKLGAVTSDSFNKQILDSLKLEAMLDTTDFELLSKGFLYVGGIRRGHRFQISSSQDIVPKNPEYSAIVALIQKKFSGSKVFIPQASWMPWRKKRFEPMLLTSGEEPVSTGWRNLLANSWRYLAGAASVAALSGLYLYYKHYQK